MWYFHWGGWRQYVFTCLSQSGNMQSAQTLPWGGCGLALILMLLWGLRLGQDSVLGPKKSPAVSLLPGEPSQGSEWVLSESIIMIQRLHHLHLPKKTQSPAFPRDNVRWPQTLRQKWWVKHSLWPGAGPHPTFPHGVRSQRKFKWACGDREVVALVGPIPPAHITQKWRCPLAKRSHGRVQPVPVAPKPFSGLWATAIVLLGSWLGADRCVLVSCESPIYLMVYEMWLISWLPLLLIWISCDVVPTLPATLWRVMWAAGGRGTLDSSCRSDPGISKSNLMLEDGNWVGAAGHPAAPSPRSGHLLFSHILCECWLLQPSNHLSSGEGRWNIGWLQWRLLGSMQRGLWSMRPVCLTQLDRTVMLQSWVDSMWGQHSARILRELFPRPSSFHGCRKLQHMLLLQWAENRPRACCALMGWLQL